MQCARSPARCFGIRCCGAQIRQRPYNRNDLCDEAHRHRNRHCGDQLGGIELPMPEQHGEQKQHDENPPEELAVAFAHDNADQRARDLAAEHQSGTHGGVGRDGEDQQPQIPSEMRNRRNCGDRDQHRDGGNPEAGEQEALGEVGPVADLILVQEPHQQCFLTDQAYDCGDLGNRKPDRKDAESVGCHRSRGQREQRKRERAAANLQEDGPDDTARDVTPQKLNNGIDHRRCEAFPEDGRCKDGESLACRKNASVNARSSGPAVCRRRRSYAAASLRNSRVRDVPD
ncbi:hypothetical protein ACVWZR_010397 [Bradyrhizobium sp. i1.3.1]